MEKGASGNKSGCCGCAQNRPGIGLWGVWFGARGVLTSRRALEESAGQVGLRARRGEPKGRRGGGSWRGEQTWDCSGKASHCHRRGHGDEEGGKV